jgi:hypothetical protein
MRQKIPALIVSLLAAIYIANAIDKAFPAETRRVEYDKLLTLAGTVTREYDMSFVNGGRSPVTDPREAARIAAEYRRAHPADKSHLHEPIPHLILHLDKPIAVQKGIGDGLHDAQRAVREIDLGTAGVPDQALGSRLFAVTGKLRGADTVHHLRPVVMEVVSILPAAR